MPNLSKLKRERMLAFLQKIKDEHRDDDDMLIALGEIESELTSKKYGLVWEQHEEAVDVMMRDHIPVFTEVPEREIIAAPGQAYNTGNRDFVYDDVYVDDLDGFKHSKWISFMSERLKIARNLLTNSGVIAISIGYQEVHNLVVLCQEMFDTKQVTCVTVQTSGGKPNGGFNYVQEYLVFIAPRDFEPNTMNFTGGIERSPFEGLTLSTFTKVTRPNQTYPIFIDKKTMNIVGVGKTLAERINDGSYTGELEAFPFNYDEAPDGTVALWPISSKGAECVWRLIPSRLRRDWDKGYIKVSKNKSKVNPNEFSVQYLPEGVIQKVESGELEVIGKEPNAPTLVFGKNKTVGSEIPTIWAEKDFYTTKGTSGLKDILGEKRFSYPKPLELITEILRAISKENSIVLDFFAGSGTTGHAVIELNAEQHSNRRFILCTNNEGNICKSVTYPRIKTVITGRRDDGSEYAMSLPANIKYYHTDFVSKDDEYLSDDLLKHIKEMIQLEHGVKIDGSQYIMVMSDEEADKLQAHWVNYKNVKAIYASKEVLFTTEQNALFACVEIHTIPDYYFDFELKEVGETW